jgi:hypothetical protein
MRRQRRGVVQHEDPFLGWMSLANAGLLHPGQVHLMDVAIASLPTDDPVLEIGAFCGYSTNVLTHLLREHRRVSPLLSIDPWVFEGEQGECIPKSTIPFCAYRDYVKTQFEQNVRFWSADRLPHPFQCTSDAFFDEWRAGGERLDLFGRTIRFGGPVAFCFVDGEHTHEQTWQDFLNCDEFLVPGGFVLFDDSDPFGAFPQVYDVVQRVLREHGYELVAENPHHLLRKPPGVAT